MNPYLVRRISLVLILVGITLATIQVITTPAIIERALALVVDFPVYGWGVILVLLGGTGFIYAWYRT